MLKPCSSISVAAVAALTLQLATTTTDTDGEIPRTFAIGKPVDPSILLIDVEGTTHQLSQYRGKILVVDFWSIDCPWSVGYESRLKSLHETYSERGVAFLAIDSNHTEVDPEADDPYARIKRYVADHTIPYRVLIDTNNDVADRFAARTTPHAYVVDPKGILRYAGAIDDDPKAEKGDRAVPYLADAIDAVLVGSEVTTPTTKPAGCTIERVEKVDVVDTAALAELLSPKEGDKAILVNFWATWCPPCLREMPELVELHARHAKNGVRVVAVALDVVAPRGRIDHPAEIHAFAAERKLELTIVAFDGDSEALNRRFELPGPIPYTIVMNAKGEVTGTQLGAASLEHFEEMVKEAVDSSGRR